MGDIPKQNGGRRPGAGRPKGSVNRLSASAIAKVTAEGITPLDYLMNLLRDENAPPEDRFKAACAAAPYVHPKLAAVEMSGGLDITSHEKALDALR